MVADHYTIAAMDAVVGSIALAIVHSDFHIVVDLSSNDSISSILCRHNYHLHFVLAVDATIVVSVVAAVVVIAHDVVPSNDDQTIYAVHVHNRSSFHAIHGMAVLPAEQTLKI